MSFSDDARAFNIRLFLGLLGVVDEMFGHVAPAGALVQLRDDLQVLQEQSEGVAGEAH